MSIDKRAELVRGFESVLMEFKKKYKNIEISDKDIHECIINACYHFKMTCNLKKKKK